MKKFEFNSITSTAAELTGYLNLWKRHGGVESLLITPDMRFMMEDIDFGRKIVHLFPSVNKFRFLMPIFGTFNPENVTRMMAPFQTCELKEAQVIVLCVDTAWLVPVLKGVSTWKGTRNQNYSITLN